MIAKLKLRVDDLKAQAETARKALGNEDIGKWERWTEDFTATDRATIAALFDPQEAEILYQETVDTPCPVDAPDVPVVTPAMTVAQLYEAKLQANLLSSMKQATCLRYQSRVFTAMSALSARKGINVNVIPAWYEDTIKMFVDAKAKAGDYMQ